MSNQSKKSFIFRILVGLLVVGGGIFWLINSQHSAAEKVLTVLPRFSSACLVGVVLLDSFQIFLMALRFWFLFPKENRTSVRNVFAAISIGQTMNAFLPARAGDFYKVATLTPKPAKPDFTILTLTGIMAADKLVDLSSFLVLIFALGSYKQSLASINFGTPQTWKLIALIVLLLIVLWRFFLAKRFLKLTDWLVQFVRGLKPLLAPKQLFCALSVGIFVWLAEALALQQLSLYQNYPITLTQSFFVLTVLNLAIAVPISVANIGPFEASIAFALKQLGMPLESALAIATVHHGLQVLAYIICGGIGGSLRRWQRSQLK